MPEVNPTVKALLLVLLCFLFFPQYTYKYVVHRM